HCYLFPHLSVIGNIIAAPVHVLHTQKKKAETEAFELLESVGLKQAVRRYPGFLSGGEQQRVAIARALAMHPALLLLDEPTSALDPRRINSLRALLRTFVDRGHTMIIISHSMGFLGGVSDHILFMEGGLVVEHGPTQEVMNSPKDVRTKDFLSQAE
ncbi:MAG TPA: ATP-binding cassette domain-containing protein, partial [Pyrinomonadaceae bacterium]|nr:ATP-binding cassette domain-containing protein [Pyrinomonadaceae bacterium]